MEWLFEVFVHWIMDGEVLEAPTLSGPFESGGFCPGS